MSKKERISGYKPAAKVLTFHKNNGIGKKSKKSWKSRFENLVTVLSRRH